MTDNWNIYAGKHKADDFNFDIWFHEDTMDELYKKINDDIGTIHLTRTMSVRDFQEIIRQFRDIINSRFARQSIKK